jgi:hypothetical protein
LELLLHLTQASPRVRVDLLAPAGAIVGGGADGGGGGAAAATAMEVEGDGGDTLLGHLLDLLAHPSYAQHPSRLEALLALVETVAVTLQGFVTPEERRRGALLSCVVVGVCVCVCVLVCFVALGFGGFV